MPGRILSDMKSSEGRGAGENHEREYLDGEFPLGEGTADRGATVACPYCAAAVEIAIDPGSGSRQEYVEDCEVCCQPWLVVVRYGGDGHADVSVTPLNE